MVGLLTVTLLECLSPKPGFLPAKHTLRQTKGCARCTHTEGCVLAAVHLNSRVGGGLLLHGEVARPHGQLCRTLMLLLVLLLPQHGAVRPETRACFYVPDDAADAAVSPFAPKRPVLLQRGGCHRVVYVEVLWSSVLPTEILIPERPSPELRRQHLKLAWAVCLPHASLDWTCVATWLPCQLRNEL